MQRLLRGASPPRKSNTWGHSTEGNFLYVTLRLLKDLEEQAIHWGGERLRIPGEFPRLDPHNVLGIELNPYAKELAGVSIWIGHIQWMLDHGYGFPRDPVLQPLDNIEQRDAILARDAEGFPIPATWPEAEFVVGNPPFLGDRRMRGQLGDEYVDDLRNTWDKFVPAGADFVCYWHEAARQQIANGATRRAGLLATNSIRGGANRRVLDRVRETGDIFTAWGDEPWVVEGASVRVSIICQDDGSETDRRFDGYPVAAINADLTADRIDLTVARRLAENADRSFIGVQKSGPFEVDPDHARTMLTAPAGPFGDRNADVVRRWVNASDLTGRPRDTFLVDFGTRTPVEDAAKYELPFEYVRTHVLPVREKVRRKSHRERWWIFGDARPGLRSALDGLSRYICSPMTSKHRLFVWLAVAVVPSNATVAIAREDDYAFGVLHSRAHELWSLRMGTWLGVGNDPRYTPTSTFETFPFPWPLDTPDEALTAQQRGQRDAIGEAARALDEARRRWLNPPELVREEPDVLPSLPPRLLPADDAAERELRRRTLTNLYNTRPAWLSHLHAALDTAVFAAYGWPESVAPSELGEEELLGRLLAVNLGRGGVIRSGSARR